MSPSAGRVTRGQVVLAVLVGLAAVPPLLVASSFIVSDLAQTGEKFDGLGLMIGGALLGPLLLAGMATAWWGWRGRGSRSGWVALALAAVLVAAELAWLLAVGWP